MYAYYYQYVYIVPMCIDMMTAYILYSINKSGHGVFFDQEFRSSPMDWVELQKSKLFIFFHDSGISKFLSWLWMIMEPPNFPSFRNLPWFWNLPVLTQPNGKTHAPHAQRICVDLRGWHKEASYTFIDVRNQGRVAARHPADGQLDWAAFRASCHGMVTFWWVSGAGNGCIPGAISLPHPEATETLASLEDDEVCLGLSG